MRNLDLDDYKDDIAAEVKDITSRDLDIKGHITFSISLKPTITVTDLTLASAPWANEPNMLSLDQLDITLDLIALLFGTFDSTQLAITGGKLFLERNSSDQANWHLGLNKQDLKQTADYLEGPFPYIHTIRLAELDVDYADRQSETNFSGRLNSFEAVFEPKSHRLRTDLDAKIQNQTLVASGTVADLLKLYTGDASAVDLSIKLGQTHLSFDGTVDSDASSVEGTFEAVGAGAGDLATLGGVTLPNLGAIDVGGKISLTPKALNLTALNARIGNNDLRGQVRMTRGKQPSFTIDLTAHHIDMTPFVTTEKSQAVATAADSPERDLLFSDQPLFFDQLPRILADVKLAIDTLVIGDLTLDDVLLQVHENDNDLKVELFKIVFKGATLTGRGSVEAAKTPKVSLKVLTQNFDLGTFLAEQNVTDLVTGEIDIGIEVQGEGNSLHAIVSNLDGTASFVMYKGRVSSGFVDFIATGLFRMLAPWSNKSKKAHIKCALAQFEIKQGVAKTRTFLFDTKKMTIRGKGKIDLRSEKVHFRLRPRPKDPTLISLATGLLLDGTLTNIKASVDPESLLIGVAEAVFADLLLGPAGILVPFASLGAGHHHPCIDHLPEVFNTHPTTSPSVNAAPTSLSSGENETSPQSAPVPTTIRIATGRDSITSNIIERHLTDLGFSDITKVEKLGAIYHVDADWQGRHLKLRVDTRRGTIEQIKP